MFIDLHVHSTASDGSLSPAEILDCACGIGLAAVAITDHDTLSGTRQALHLPRPAGLGFVTGVEISARRPQSLGGAGSLHLLGYGIRVDDPGLMHALERLQSARQRRNPQILERLKALGIGLCLEEIREARGGEGQIGRPHIASVLVARRVVASIDEAFDRYLGTGRPAYVDKYRVPCQEAIRAIAQAGGVAVLAHPGLLKLADTPSLEALVAELQRMGLRGIEAHYPEHTPAQTRRFLDLARRRGLMVTGGTDFHGPTIKPGIAMGFAAGDFHVPYALYEALTAAL